MRAGASIPTPVQRLDTLILFASVFDVMTADSFLSSLPVLVVEDDMPTRKLLDAVVRRSGFDTRFASNGAEAIELMRTTIFAAVILDLMMPTVGGHDVIAFIAGNGVGVPVVVCSAASPSMLTGFDPTVVKAVVRKPFDVDEFMTIVRRVAIRA